MTTDTGARISVNILCGDCKAKNQPPVPWEDMIKRHHKHVVLSL